MKTILLTLLASFILGLNVNAENYRLNESAINDAFSQSYDVTNSFMSSINGDLVGPVAPMLFGSEGGSKSQTTAAIIAFAVTVGGGTAAYMIYWTLSVVSGGVLGLFCWPILIAPILPWHRWYLGTGGNGAKTGLLYCVTLDWCGWLSIIDGIMLLVDDTDSKFVDNPKYLMWVD